MGKGILRVGVVGSSSLLGKELVEELGDSALGLVDLVLLDEDVEAGQVTAAGDEATFVQRIDSGSFVGLDLCFFAGNAEETRRHAAAALRADVGVIDLTNALAGQDGVVVRAPWIRELPGSRLQSGATAIIPAHPVAVLLGLVVGRCASLGLSGVAATVLEPASERGAAGLDEMHQQTVHLLSFQSVPKVEFDAQVAFNLLPALGPAARMAMDATAARIREDYRMAGLGSAPDLALQLVHAPVFHGYGVSLLLDFEGAVTAEAVRGALVGDPIEVVANDEEPPSNVSAAGRKVAMVRVEEGTGRRLWVWMAADNLKMAALQGIACGAELVAAGPAASRKSGGIGLVN